MEDVKHIINIIIRAKSAESGPPLGTVLGNIGVNAVKFAKEFNEYTEDLPDYFKLNVKILISRNNNFTFTTSMPTTGYILSLLRKETEYLLKNGTSRKLYYFDFDDLMKLALLKFPKLTLQKSIKIILGSAKSCKIKIQFNK